LQQSHQRYRKGNHAKREIIPNRVGIEHCPAIVNKKKQFGDREADTVLMHGKYDELIVLVSKEITVYQQ